MWQWVWLSVISFIKLKYYIHTCINMIDPVFVLTFSKNICFCINIIVYIERAVTHIETCFPMLQWWICSHWRLVLFGEWEHCRSNIGFRYVFLRSIYSPSWPSLISMLLCAHYVPLRWLFLNRMFAGKSISVFVTDNS